MNSIEGETYSVDMRRIDRKPSTSDAATGHQKQHMRHIVLACLRARHTGHNGRTYVIQ